MVSQTITAICCFIPFIWTVIQCNALKTQGKEFYFAFFPYERNYPSESYANDVYISAVLGTQCTLTYGNGESDRFYIPGGTISNQKISVNNQLTSDMGIQKKGIHLSCTESVSAYAYNRDPYFTDSHDSYTLLPIEVLSTQYLLIGFEVMPVVSIIATSPNTTVTVDLKATCLTKYFHRHYGNVDIMKFTLSDHDVLQIVKDPFIDTAGPCDFTGSVIQSTSPVAVFSGSVFFYDSDAHNVDSHMMVQVPPLSAFSKTVIVPHVSKPASNTNIRIIPSQDNTSLSIVSQPEGNKSLVFVKDRVHPAEFSFTADKDIIVQSDKPVLVIQTTLFKTNSNNDDNSLFMFIPGILEYERNYILQSFYHYSDSHRYKTILTIVSETSGKNTIYINGITPKEIEWREVNGTDYSVGIMTVDEYHMYHVNSTSPIFVRLQLVDQYLSYWFIGGYRIPTTIEKLRKSIDFQCHGNNWLVTVDVSGLSLSREDTSNIYLGVNTCTGNLLGDLLIFNVSYTQCHTENRTRFGNVVFSNTLWYNALSANNITRKVQRLGTTTCFTLTPSKVTTSGPIQGIHVQIKLFQDASYCTTFTMTDGKEQRGQFVYVQVLAASSLNLTMIINTCEAHLTNSIGNYVMHPLISHGCPVDQMTHLTDSRKQVTRFRFQIFTSLPDIYVTCDVSFCGGSSNCHEGCKTKLNPDIIGK